MINDDLGSVVKYMKKTYFGKIIIVFQFIVIIGLIAFIFITIYKINDKASRQEIVKFTNNNHSIVINQIGNPIPFGDTTVEIVILETDKNTYKKRTYCTLYIANDSKTLSNENFSIEWLENGIELSVHAEEQPDCTYDIVWNHVFQEDFPILHN